MLTFPSRERETKNERGCGAAAGTRSEGLSGLVALGAALLVGTAFDWAGLDHWRTAVLWVTAAAVAGWPIVCLSGRAPRRCWTSPWLLAGVVVAALLYLDLVRP